MPASPFSLSKWYLDCCTKEGEACIIYAAELTLYGIKLTYSSHLLCSPEGTLETKQTFLNGSLPVLKEDSTIVCDSSKLNFHGTWSPLTPPAPRINQYEKNGKYCHWTCLQAKSQVDLSLSGRAITGIGYAERLDMTLPPWELPVKQLYWGRFHGEKGTTLSWIIWEGSFPFSILLRGNTPIKADDLLASPSGNTLSWGNHSLFFHQTHIIRTGKIGDTVLPSLPSMIKGLLPQKILNLKENKWFGDAVFSSGEEKERGTAIHELVSFA